MVKSSVKNLVCVIVYKREENIKLWLKCWKKADTEDSQLMIIHNQDDLSILSPLKELCEIAGVIYHPRQNLGMDIGATKEILTGIIPVPGYDYFLWFTDDIMPIRPTFIHEFVFAARFGVSCYNLSNAITTHIRTVGYCLRKDIASKIKFKDYVTKDDCWGFEYQDLENSLYKQVVKLGAPPQMLTKTVNYSPVWDSDPQHDGRLDRWKEQSNCFKFFDNDSFIEYISSYESSLEISDDMLVRTNLYCFYHIYADGNWNQTLKEFITELKNSGLYNNLKSIYIGIVGTIENRNKVKTYLDSQIKYTIVAEETVGWEQVTLNHLYEFSKTNSGNVLYAHTKGSTRIEPVIDEWRRVMIKNSITKWRIAIERLGLHTAVGSYWFTPQTHQIPNKTPYFAGNFWWTRLEHIKTLRIPNNASRFGAETWIGENYVESPFNVFEQQPDGEPIGLKIIPKVEVLKLRPTSAFINHNLIHRNRSKIHFNK